MSKLIIVYYTWDSTATNHAGMAYLVKRLKEKYVHNIELVEIPQRIYKWGVIKKMLFHVTFAFELKKKFNYPENNILFMEFFGGHIYGNHTKLAQYMRLIKFKGKLFGMVHLPPFKIKQVYKSDARIKKYLNYLDKAIVMGSSLRKYLECLNTSASILFTPHYVDTDYYTPANKAPGERIQLISVGNTFRDIKMLYEIVSKVNSVDFHICAGPKINLYHRFQGLKNVKLYDQLSEEELLNKMQEADIGISVMEDTIGSNVIVTSLAVGLPQIVSNVGSITDYCDSSNAVFCNSIYEFEQAIKNLSMNRHLLAEMKNSALVKAGRMNINSVLNWFKQELINNG